MKTKINHQRRSAASDVITEVKGIEVLHLSLINILEKNSN